MEAATLFHGQGRREGAADSLRLPGWPLEAWQALFAHASPVHLGSGEVLIRRGDQDRALYFVVSGELEVRAHAGGGSDALGQLFRESPGSVFGEISLFDGKARTATVWATKPTELLKLDLSGLQAFNAQHPDRGNELLFALGEVLAMRLRRSEDSAARRR